MSAFYVMSYLLSLARVLSRQLLCDAWTRNQESIFVFARASLVDSSLFRRVCDGRTLVKVLAGFPAALALDLSMVLALFFAKVAILGANFLSR